MIPHGTPEWIKARLGKLTASRIADATARLKGSKKVGPKVWGATRANYIAELLAERLTAVQYTRYVSREMRYGTENEPHAIAAYEWENSVTVVRGGYIEHPYIPMCGASPDGFIDDDGLVEVKVPNVATHVAFLLTDEVDEKYRKQMAWQLACTERAWCDFTSYSPEMPMQLQLRVRRFERDEKLIAELTQDAHDFLAEVAAKERALRLRLLSPEEARAEIDFVLDNAKPPAATHEEGKPM